MYSTVHAWIFTFYIFYSTVFLTLFFSSMAKLYNNPAVDIKTGATTGLNFSTSRFSAKYRSAQHTCSLTLSSILTSRTLLRIGRRKTRAPIEWRVLYWCKQSWATNTPEWYLTYNHNHNNQKKIWFHKTIIYELNF